MNSAGAKALVDSVEQATGYKVVIDTIEGISEDAQMISARPELPVHSIRVNKAKLRQADYIVAIQCTMLLRLWSNPERIPVFSPVVEKVHYQIDRAANSKPLTQFPPKIASQTAQQFIQGLINQLRSMPTEIHSIRDVRAQCPDLHDIQTEAVEGQLRVQSENFSPRIRSIATEHVWKTSVSMNSAYALSWSQLSDSTIPMLPYQSAGFSEIAAKLLGELTSRQEKTSESYTQAVDAWAEHLGLHTLYKWEYRNGRQ